VSAWEQTARLAAQLLPGWQVRLHYNSSVFYPANMLNRSSSAVPGQRLCWLRTLGNVELVDMHGAALPAEWWAYAPALEGDAVAAVFVRPVAAAAATTEPGATFTGPPAEPAPQLETLERQAGPTTVTDSSYRSGSESTGSYGRDAGGALEPAEGVLGACSMERAALWQACGARVLRPQSSRDCGGGRGAGRGGGVGCCGSGGKPDDSGDGGASTAAGGCGAGGSYCVWGVRGGPAGLGAVQAAVLRAVRDPGGADARGLRRGSLAGLGADEAL
jgi:hypothetical protein